MIDVTEQRMAFCEVARGPLQQQNLRRYSGVIPNARPALNTKSQALDIGGVTLL